MCIRCNFVKLMTLIFSGSHKKFSLVFICYITDDSFLLITHFPSGFRLNFKGTQREYSSKSLKHGIVKRALVFER